MRALTLALIVACGASSAFAQDVRWPYTEQATVVSRTYDGFVAINTGDGRSAPITKYVQIKRVDPGTTETGQLACVVVQTNSPKTPVAVTVRDLAQDPILAGFVCDLPACAGPCPLRSFTTAGKNGLATNADQVLTLQLVSSP